jgi:hypothetical protein
VFHVKIFAWVLLYGFSLAIAADQKPTHSKINWKSVFPYCVALMPLFFRPVDHGLSDAILSFLFFIIITWVLVFFGKKQCEYYSKQRIDRRKICVDRISEEQSGDRNTDTKQA